jgi:hypothetical protein
MLPRWPTETGQDAVKFNEKPAAGCEIDGVKARTPFSACVDGRGMRSNVFCSSSSTALGWAKADTAAAGA